MAFDEGSMYVQPVSTIPPTNSYVIPDARNISQQATAQVYSGTYSGQLLTCPDDCVDGLTEMIQSADDEILLSLQYLDLNWKWGWGENPVISALEEAAMEGVSIFPEPIHTDDGEATEIGESSSTANNLQTM